ncbi:MAG: sigma-54-dependent Fis family transcriptional regulator [Acidobacteriota bacterium]
MSTLRLATSYETWSRYQSSQLPQRLEDEALLRAWGRSEQAGAPSSGTRPGELVLSATELQGHRERCEPLLTDGAQALQQAAKAFGQRDHILLLADRDGVITHSAGGGDFEDTARSLYLIPGAHWSESFRGTNAIGTALAERSSVTVEGAGHWGQRYHGLVCYASPVFGPDGSLVGILDATSLQENADPALAGTVAAAARVLELVLRAQAWAGAGAAARRTVEALLDKLPSPGLVVEPGGAIVRCNAAARQWLGETSLPLAAEEHLGSDWQTLAAEALASGGELEARLAGRAALRLKVEPVLDPSGRLLAAVVYGEPLAARTTLSSDAGGSSSLRASFPRAPNAERSFTRSFDAIFAQDPALLAAVHFAKKVAVSDLAIMLLSETGSGKELFARAIHQCSPRGPGPFVPVNCGSFSPELLESELFGYAPGAFTGAGGRGRDGLLAAADGGTLFLDEVAEMPPRMQTALLRVLEDGRYHRVGETKERHTDARIVCATCRDLPRLVESGAFRKDLYYRLRSVTLSLPALRERSDRLALAEHLLEADEAPFSPALARWIESYPWPGNVRELKSVLEVVQLLGAGAAELDIQHLPPDLQQATASLPAPESSSLARLEVEAVRRAVQQASGNISAAARRLGIARSTIYRILKRSE